MLRVSGDIFSRLLENVSTVLVHLTQSTAVEFNSHGNVAVPTPDINPHVTSHKRSEETMSHHKVPLDICFEDLQTVTLILLALQSYKFKITFLP